MRGLDVDAIADRTPPERDRVVDAVRLGAIGAVVLGHWLVAVVLVRDGELVTGRLLDVVPEVQVLTYLFQVMPLFFLVGGAVNLASWDRAAARGTSAPVWIRRRARRLLVPVLPLLALWIPLAVVLGRVGLPADEVALATQTAFLPVWFLAVYLIAIGMVPITAWLHRRVGFGPVVTAAVVGTGVVDLLHRAEVPVVGFLNYVLVWVGIHQLGYAWADDRLPTRRSHAAGLVGVGVAAIVVLVAVVGYPLSVVATETSPRNNTDPPTLVLWGLTVAQLGVLLWARPTLERALRRPRVWAPVALAGSVLITVFLWHMTALVVAAALTHPTGLWPATDRVDAAWWAWRPLWLLLCAAVLAVLVAVFRRFEEPADPVPRDGRLRTLLGIAATVAGLALVLTGGLYTPNGPATSPSVRSACCWSGSARSVPSGPDRNGSRPRVARTGDPPDGGRAARCGRLPPADPGALVPTCRPESPAFTATAPLRFTATRTVGAPPDRVFATLADASSWPRWFPGLDAAHWTSEPPFGVGSTRVVEVGPLEVEERFIAWEPQQRFGFTFVATNLPGTRAGVELVELVPAGDERTRVAYTMALEPVGVSPLLGRRLAPVGRLAVARGLAGLDRYLTTAPSR